MTKEEIIRTARKCGTIEMNDVGLERFAALVAAAAKAEEREACAKLADAADMYNRFISQEIAAAIRARSNT